MTDERYPIGKYERRDRITAKERGEHIRSIEAAPAALRKAVEGLTAEQLDTPYREGGWTVRQVAHHVPDSHMNAYIRVKLALTEENPTIKPYDEAAWAGLVDSQETPVETSLRLLESVHERFTILLRSLDDEQCARTLLHPDNGPMTIDGLITLYSWHGRHHVGHIMALRERNGW
jgi:uncharacterized damage-inducible protein DinB